MLFYKNYAKIYNNFNTKIKTMCYNVIMVKQTLKVITKIPLIAAIFAIILMGAKPAIAADVEEANTNFQVNVKESLTVSIGVDTSENSGDMDEFLRNTVNLSVKTNNSAGFTASMTMKTTETALKSGSNSLPTLTAGSTRGSFPANYWGYSFDDTAAGSATSNYAALVPSNATPITVLASNTSSGNRTFYFGAKGNSSTPSGTYIGTVVVSVVSGAIGPDNPITPVDPITPEQYNVSAYYPSRGGSSNGATVYSTVSGNTVTSEVTDGDNRCSIYGEGCNPGPLGELYDTYAKISNGSMLATALAITAGVTATSGIFFFVLAKRDDDDNEDEEEL